MSGSAASSIAWLLALVVTATVSGSKARGDDGRALEARGAPSLLVSGGRGHLWLVHRSEGRARLGHIATTMPEGEMREGALLPSGAPLRMASWEDRVYLLYPGRSAVMPRAHLLGARAARHPATGAWITLPPDRLDLLPALPQTLDHASAPDVVVESLAATTEGPLILYEGDSRLWRLHRGLWSAIDLPEALATASRRRIEGLERGFTILADSGPDHSWERWRCDEGIWQRVAVGAGAEASITPVDGMSGLVVMDGARRRLAYLPDDGPLELAELDRDESAAWFGPGPVIIRDDPALVMVRVDPGRGERSEPRAIRAQRPVAAAWFHLPILGAIAIAVLMVVFFIRAIRDPGSQALSLPSGVAPLPLTPRLVALAVDLVPGLAAAKLFWGVPWSIVVTPPAFVLHAETAVVPLTALLTSVLISGAAEAVFGTSPGKWLMRSRVVSLRAGERSRPALIQTLARNVFKAVILQMPPLGLFTLLDPLRRGVGEMVSATAVVRAMHPTDHRPARE